MHWLAAAAKAGLALLLEATAAVGGGVGASISTMAHHPQHPYNPYNLLDPAVPQPFLAEKHCFPVGADPAH